MNEQGSEQKLGEAVNILTPEQIEQARYTPADRVEQIQQAVDLYDTLAAYAEVVQAVAEKSPYDDEFFVCIWCGAKSHWHEGVDVTVHAPDCSYLLARKLRGLA